jgi:hypothetical protein
MDIVRQYRRGYSPLYDWTIDYFKEFLMFGGSLTFTEYEALTQLEMDALRDAAEELQTERNA